MATSGCWALVGGVLSAEKETGGVVYRDVQSGFFVRSNVRGGARLTGGEGRVAEPGVLAPGVLEYVIAHSRPLLDYYTVALSLRQPPGRVAADVASARRLLPRGQPATALAFSRTLGRRLVSPVNRALTTPGKYQGSAAIYWGLQADRDRGAFKSAVQVFDRKTELQTTVYRYYTARIVVVESNGRDGLMVWDVSGVPGAFSASGADYQTVAAKIRPLHPLEGRTNR